MRFGATILVLLVAVSAAPTRAHAQPHVSDPDAYRHDGFYLRLGLGFTALADGLASGRTWDDEFEAQGRVSGIGTANELALGGTIAPGFVLGGGVFGTTVLATDFVPEADADIAALPREVQPGSLHLVGPFVDYYLEERGGFHIAGALGFSVLSGVGYDVGRIDDGDDDPAVGVGVMLAVGYEWWVGEQWSLGVAGRMMGALLGEEDEEGFNWLHVIGTFPGVLFTVTYH